MSQKGESKAGLTATQKILIVGFAIILIVLIVGGVMLYNILMKQPEPQMVIQEDSRGSYLIDENNVSEIMEVVGAEIADGMFMIDMNMYWKFPDGKSPSSNARIANSAANRYNIAFELYIDATGENVYTSTIIPRGKALKELVLQKNLPAGEYPATCLYHMLDAEGKSTSSLSIAVTLQILK